MHYSELIYNELYQKFVHNNIRPHTLKEMRCIHPLLSKGHDLNNHDWRKAYSRHSQQAMKHAQGMPRSRISRSAPYTLIIAGDRVKGVIDIRVEGGTAYTVRFQEKIYK